MPSKTICILCEGEAEEHPVSGQDKYETRCKICRHYHLTQVDNSDKIFKALPEEIRKKLSIYVKSQFESTHEPVFLDDVNKFIEIIGICKK